MSAREVLPVVIAHGWLLDLIRLADRFHYWQVAEDLSGMNLDELRGVYQRLLRMEADEKEADQ